MADMSEDAMEGAEAVAENEYNSEIKNNMSMYTFDDGDYNIKEVLAVISEELPQYVALIEHLFKRLRHVDDLPHDPAKRFEELVRRAAMDMGEPAAVVAGVVSGDAIYGTLQGDVSHRATLLNVLSRKQRKDWLTMELKKLEEQG